MNCRVCNSDSLEFQYKVKGWPLYRCSQCQLVQVTIKPTCEQLIEIYSKSYFSHSKYIDIKTLYKEYDRRLDILKKYLADNSKILDFGCAQADFIEFAADKYQFWGYDFSHYAIQKGKKKNSINPDKLYSGNEFDSLYRKVLFDAIVLWDVIEHLWDIEIVIEKLIFILKPGGYIFISTPNIDANISKILRKYWAFMTPPEHLSFFTRKTFTYISIRYNLKLLEWHTKGKWANVGFILYKSKRIIPYLIPDFIIKLFRTKSLSKIAIFVPTFDIQYLILQKAK